MVGWETIPERGGSKGKETEVQDRVLNWRTACPWSVLVGWKARG